MKTTTWMMPDDIRASIEAQIEQFNASLRQDRFRSVAQEMVSDGDVLMHAWFKKFNENLCDDEQPLTWMEWQRWVENAAFKGWFFMGFPIQDLSGEEVRMMDHLWMKGVKNGLKAGDGKAFDLWAKFRWGRKDKSNDAEIVQELEEFISSGQGGKKWKRTTDAEA